MRRRFWISSSFRPMPSRTSLPRRGAAPGAVPDRLPHCLRLLVDLLQHESLVAALLGDLVVPVHRLDVLVLDLAFVVEEPCALGRDRDNLAFVDQLHAARLAEERGDR